MNRLVAGVLPIIVVLGSAVRAELADPWQYSPLSLKADETAARTPSSKSAEELAKLAQNPVANLISVPFQNNFNFGIGPKNATQWVLNVQPVIPITLNEDWNLITRTIVPVIYQGSPADGISSDFGLGDTTLSLFLSPAKPGKWIWGIGPILGFPTGTDSDLTSGKWSAGPSFVALRIDDQWVYGCLVSQLWSFAGWGDDQVNLTTIQPFVNYNFPGGWYLSVAPILTANWAADDYSDVWTIPIGGGGGKIVHLGKLPVNLQLQAFYNVATPREGPDWQLRFQIQFLFPR